MAPTMQRLVISLEQVRDRQLTLTEAQQHYLARVLRLGVGDRFLAMDGQGATWLAVLAQGHPHLQAELLEAVVVQTELAVAVTLVAALPKGNGFDEVVRQATELGVATISPVISERTLLQPSPQKLERWRRIAQEAAEQAERQIVPKIEEPLIWENYLRQNQEPAGLKLICVARGSHPSLLQILSQQCAGHPTPTLLAIGPEGGWTKAEVAGAISVGYQPVSLGNRILRAVTAPIVALALAIALVEEATVKGESLPSEVPER